MPYRQWITAHERQPPQHPQQPTAHRRIRRVTKGEVGVGIGVGVRLGLGILHGRRAEPLVVQSAGDKEKVAQDLQRGRPGQAKAFTDNGQQPTDSERNVTAGQALQPTLHERPRSAYLPTWERTLGEGAL